MDDYAPLLLDLPSEALDAPADDYTRATRRHCSPKRFFSKVWAMRQGALRRPRRVATPSYRIEPQATNEEIVIDGPTQVFRRSANGEVRQGNLLQSRSR